MTIAPENQGGLGDLVSARKLLNDGIKKLNGATWDYQLALDRLQREAGEEFQRGFDQRDEDGQRLYVLLALFDTRDGSPLAQLVQAAREGWERSHTDMAEDEAWMEFDRLWDSTSQSERAALASSRKEQP